SSIEASFPPRFLAQLGAEGIETWIRGTKAATENVLAAVFVIGDVTDRVDDKSVVEEFAVHTHQGPTHKLREAAIFLADKPRGDYPKSLVHQAIQTTDGIDQSII